MGRAHTLCTAPYGHVGRKQSDLRRPPPRPRAAAAAAAAPRARRAPDYRRVYRYYVRS